MDPILADQLLTGIYCFFGHALGIFVSRPHRRFYAINRNPSSGCIDLLDCQLHPLFR